MIDEVSTQAFSNAVFLNLTDVSLAGLRATFPQTHRVSQDRTHSPEYYNPHFDIKIDHGTASSLSCILLQDFNESFL